jgi:hypothetical protein
VPELRTDNMTTIPFPVARTKYESERERERERQQDPNSANPSFGPRTGRPSDNSGIRPETSGTTNGGTNGGSEVTGWSRTRVRSAEPNDAAEPANGDSARRKPQPTRTEDGDREALRPWFDKLNRARDEERPVRSRDDAGQRSRDEQVQRSREDQGRQRSRSAGTPRAEPREIRSEGRRERQPPPPPPPNDGGSRDRGAVRRDKNRDNNH